MFVFEHCNIRCGLLARNLKLTLAYDGHDFAGWQVQPDRVTIQGTLLSVFEHLTGEKTLPQGSGRTDAGVHALAQTASVTLESPIPAQNLVRALNDVLPRSIRVLAVEEMPPEFREWFVRFGDGGYVTLYRFDGELVAILAVRHGKEAGY